MKTLVLGIGNDLLADDGAGIYAARLLKERLGERADVVETSASGMSLLELFLGYDRAFLIDAIHTGRHRPGEVFDIDASLFTPCTPASPHYVGLSDMFEIAKNLDLEFPSEVHVVAIEVEDPLTIGGEVTESVRRAIPKLADHVEALVTGGLAAVD